jgi:GT2 family glycosyltransferase
MAGVVAALQHERVDQPAVKSDPHPHPRVGVVGLLGEHEDGALQRSSFPFLTRRTELDRGLRLGILSRYLSRWSFREDGKTAARVDWVSGACMLVRREVFDAVGLLDPEYFLYYEEVDLCLRAARAGWECWYEPRARVMHLVGQATGVNPTDTARRPPQYVLESRRRYFVKNFGATYARLADVAWLAGHLAWRARMRVQRRDAPVAEGLLRDFVRHSALVRRTGR